MPRPARRVALMLDLQWPYKRHAEVFAGVQRYAVEQGWVSILDEFAHDTLRTGRGAAPYDGIVVTAAAPQVPPPLVEQLKPGARLVIPVGLPGSVQELRVVDKHADGTIATRNILLVAFVPLTRAPSGSDRG